MGKKDYGHRETRKPKKDARKDKMPQLFVQSVQVPEVRKVRRPSDREAGS